MPAPKLSDSDRGKLKEEIRAIMIRCAKARETISYSDLTLQLQSARLHYHSFLFARLLDEIGREEMAAGRGVLPAVVVRKTTGVPGPGYFRETAHLGHDAADLERWWRDDLEAVFDLWATAPDEQ